MKILAPKAAVAKFRRECRKVFPREHMAVLYGQRTPEGDVLITEIVPIPYTSTAIDTTVPDQQRVFARSKIKALRNGVEWLGTIHSHCDSAKIQTCPHPSSHDIRTALRDGEVVFGIVYVCAEGTQSSVHWYVPHPIPKVTYA